MVVEAVVLMVLLAASVGRAGDSRGGQIILRPTATQGLRAHPV